MDREEPRYGHGRTSTDHREGRCWLPALSPPSPALPRLIPTRVTEEETPSSRAVTALSRKKRDKQCSWVLFNRPLMLQRHKIGTWEFHL